MRLQSGRPAIDFEIEDYDGNPIRLSDYRGRKVLLSFYRYAACPLCNLRVHSLIGQFNHLKKSGLDIIAFFESDNASIAKNVGKQNAPFPVIGDPRRVIYKQYGVESSWPVFLASAFTQFTRLIKAATNGFWMKLPENDIALLPADFLIDERGHIARSYYGKHISDHLPLEDITSWLENQEPVVSTKQK